MLFIDGISVCIATATSVLTDWQCKYGTNHPQLTQHTFVQKQKYAHE